MIAAAFAQHIFLIAAAFAVADAASLSLSDPAAAVTCPCAALKTYCDYSPAACPRANVCHGTATPCSCTDCPGTPGGACKNCTAPPKPTPPTPAGKRCYADGDCPANQWCPVQFNAGAGDVYNCTSTPPPSGCTSYALMPPGDEGYCKSECDGGCSSVDCAVYDDGSVPGAPYNSSDLLYLAETCASGRWCCG